MIVDGEQLRKSALLLQEIFEEAYRAREENNLKTAAKLKDDGSDVLTIVAIGEMSVDAHTLFDKVLDNYNWDLKKFFQAAANPQIDLYSGKDSLEVNKKRWKVDRDDLMEHKQLALPEKTIEMRAKHAMVHIENFAARL